MAPSFEGLEPRRMMSATLTSGVLRVVGTAADDVIAVQYEKGKYVVRTNGARDGAFTPAAVKSIVIDARGGDDYVTVAASVNRRAQIFGGDGDDALLGGPANDLLDGGAGDDALRGRGGDDRIVTGPAGGSDAADGGAGNDTIDYSAMTAETSVDLDEQHGWTTNGNDPDDALLNFEIIQGGKGDDYLDGGHRTIAIYGNGGDDYLWAQQGRATSLFGGAGDDQLTGARYAANILDGGPGTDTADYDHYYDGDRNLTITLDDDANDGAAGEGDNVLNVENVKGGDGNDRIVGNDLANVLSGDWGDDTIIGAGGNDTLNGQDGADSLDGGEGDDVLNGGYWNDVLVGGGGRDALYGNEGDDRLYARDFESDYLNGGAGYDRALIDLTNALLKRKDTHFEVELASELLINI